MDNYNVHFEFILEPGEAEDLSSFFYREIGAMKEEIMETMANKAMKEKDRKKTVKWCKKRINYIEGIKTKVITSCKKVEMA